MSNLDLLKKEVIENPEDMTPRLVMADWLEEQGDTRGEFIRIQCQLGELTEEAREFDELDRRQLKIIKEYREEWVAHLRPFCKQARLYRGFAEDVLFGVRQYINHSEQVYELEPVRLTRIMRVSEKTFDEVMTHPTLKHWREVGLPGGFNSTQWQTLANHPELNALGKIRFTQRIAPEFVKVFLEGAVTKQLTEIDWGWVGVDAEGVSHIARTENLPNLKKLVIGYANTPESLFSQIVNNECFSNLETLSYELNFKYSNQHDQHAWSDHAIPSIVHLHLKDNPLPTKFVVELFQRFNWPNLKRINLDNCGVSSEAIQQIAQTDRIAQISTLEISRNPIGDIAMQQLLSNGKVDNLRVLRIASCGLTDETAKFILESEELAELNRLDLSSNPISSDLQKALRNRYGRGVCTFSRAPKR